MLCSDKGCFAVLLLYFIDSEVQAIVLVYTYTVHYVTDVIMLYYSYAIGSSKHNNNNKTMSIVIHV